jgi:hypothetical protein
MQIKKEKEPQSETYRQEYLNLNMFKGPLPAASLA